MPCFFTAGGGNFNNERHSRLFKINYADRHAFCRIIFYIGNCLIELIILHKRFFPKPGKVFAGGAVHAMKKIVRCWMFESPLTYIMTKRIIEPIGPNYMIS